MASQTFKIKRTINAPASEIFRMFTHATAWRDWFCDGSQAHAIKGGRLYLWWGSGHYVNGEYTTLEPGKKIVFTWDGRDEPEPTRVQITLKEKDGATLITVAHSGVGSGKKWARTIRGVTHGRAEGLENLQSVMESGIDLRIARRPRLGVFVGDFNAEIAARLGLPVTAGVRLDGTVEGTGAHAAGLQKDDVIVKLGGKRMIGYYNLGGALDGRKAGDKLPVVFYRGGEKKTATMELSARPMPTAPLSAAELAEAARKIYAELDAEWAKLLADVSEPQADFKPAANEWSIKETVAHFVACERDLQSWIAELINGGNLHGEAQDSLEFRPNVDARLRVIVERYGTLPALMDELKRAEAETVSLLEKLPPEFVARKHL
ncbi:MAG: SRPBCC domain-containing protein, partial [Chloroflexota bacterium]